MWNGPDCNSLKLLSADSSPGYCRYNPESSALAGYNVYRTPDNAITPFNLLNTDLVWNTHYTDIHPASTEPNTTWLYTVTAVFQDSYGAFICEGHADTIPVSFPVVGVGNPEPESIAIYPNPASTHVNIVSTSTIRTVEMFNYLGQMVYSNSVEGLKKTVLDVSGYDPGVYFVEVTTPEGNKTAKITVTH